MQNFPESSAVRGEATSRRRQLVATRVTLTEKALIEALAKTEGQTITALVYDLVIPEVRQRLSEALSAT